MAVQDTLNEALSHHQAGRLAEAEGLYRRILETQPGHPDALHLLGVIAHQQGRNEQSVELIRCAIALNASNAAYYSNLGVALRGLKRYDEALAQFQRAVSLQPAYAIAHKNLGTVMRDLGQPQEAAGHLRRALELTPDDPAALKNLGACLMAIGQLQQAADLFARAAALRPDDPEALNNLGAALNDLHRPAEAEGHLRKALALAPDHAEACNNLGLALSAQGRLDQAVEALRRAIALDPDFALAYNNLGVALKDLGRLAEAEAALRRSIQLDADYVAAHNNLGDVLNAVARHDEAVVHLQRALALDPKCHAAHNNLGVALSNLEQPQEATRHLQRAIELDPKYLPAHINLGNTLVGQGRIQEGTVHFLEALNLNPDFSPVYYALASNSRHAFTDEQISRMESLLARSPLSAEDRTLLSFALAQVLERAGRYDDAFAYCRQANDLRKAQYAKRNIAFSIEAHTSLVDGIIATCTPEFFAQRAAWGADSEVPVFVVGMPRSSTTLVEQILSSHPAVFGAGELPDIERLVADLPSILTTPTRYPECLAEAPQATVRRLADDHVQHLASLGGPAARVIDKMTVNFLHLGLIAVLFPKARVIHCQRDARDVCVSCYFHNFARAGLCFTFDLQHLGAFYTQYERLMAHWRRALPLAMIEVPYEELVRDQEAVTRRMVDFCGLDWDPQCLAFHKNPRPVKTASSLQVRQPMYKTSVSRWKRFEPHLKPFTDWLTAR